MNELEQMARVADAAFQSELARLQPKLLKVRTLEAELAALTSQKNRQISASNDIGALSTLSAYMAWSNKRRSQVQLDLAKALAEKEAQLSAARSAFGRAQAAQALVERERAARKHRTARKAQETF